MPLPDVEVEIEGGSLVFHTLVFETKVERLGTPDKLLANAIQISNEIFKVGPKK